VVTCVPAYNEENTIAKVLVRASPHLRLPPRDDEETQTRKGC